MVKNSSFVVVQGWMITELGLKGIELFIYAIIYGFSQDGQSVFSGTASYLADWTGSTKQTVFGALKKLREKGYIERVEKQVNGVTLVDYKILQGVKKFNWGSQKILPGGSQKILPHNIDIDNINNNINNTSTPLAASAKEISKPKKKNALQVFCNCVAATFEDDVVSNEQKRVWFKRNCRALSDILAFCDKDIERAMFTIQATCDWLDENNLQGGYEAVLRHLPEMHAKALKRINNGERWAFTDEQLAQINELNGIVSETITPDEAESNKKQLGKMLGGLKNGGTL